MAPLENIAIVQRRIQRIGLRGERQSGIIHELAEMNYIQALLALGDRQVGEILLTAAVWAAIDPCILRGGYPCRFLFIEEGTRRDPGNFIDHGVPKTFLATNTGRPCPEETWKRLNHDVNHAPLPDQADEGPLFVAAFVLLTFFLRIIGLITDWFWFQEVGYTKIFTITLLAKIKTAALFGMGFFVLFYLNLWLALRLSGESRFTDSMGPFAVPLRDIAPGAFKMLILAASVLFGIFAAMSGVDQWENLLLFLNPTPFMSPDPLFKGCGL